MDTKSCSACGQEKPLNDFPNRTSGGRSYPHVYCRPCRKEKRKTYASESGPYREQYYAQYWSLNKDRINESRRQERIANPVAAILADSLKADKKKGRQNDLDQSFVAAIIEKPCDYCGEDQNRMTLDRIDNSLGHTKDNVVQACYRCNCARGDMPQAAWAFLVEGMRKAREAGAFGEWRSVPYGRKP